MTVTIDALRAAGILSPLDDHFARAMARIGNEVREEVVLAAAMTSQQINNGHVCLDLARLADTAILYDEEGQPVAERPWPDLEPWLEALRSSPLVGDGGTVTPLVLDAAGRLHLRRYWEHEERLAAALRTRATQMEAPADPTWLRAALDRLFPPEGSLAPHAAEPDWQRIAALLALQRRFCVISGGPGTGKTFTVVKILALLVEEVAQVTGDQLPQGAAAPDDTGIWDCIVQLTRSYRYGPESGIGTLARAINAGDAEMALQILDSGDYPDVTRAEPLRSESLGQPLRTAVVRGFTPYLKADEPLAQLRGLENFRVLCAHRRGPAGVERVNEQIEEALADAELIRPTSATYVGRPVMVTRNDYQLELFNGDVGIVVDDPERAGGKLTLFPASQRTVRRLSPSRLPPHETVYAMSVHKSQGSEFDEVAVLLPEQASPVVSRELLYTAVTRARHRVTILGSREIIEHAITHPIERASGLRDLLWGATAPEP